MTTRYLTPLLIFWLAACAAPEIHAQPALLPTPVVKITHAAPIPPVSASPRPESTSTPNRAPLSELEEAAAQAFGERQITRVEIPALGISSRVTPVGWRIRFEDDFRSGAFEWDSPGGDVGWVVTSALPDETGNAILYGHNNLYSRVFRDLYKLQNGGAILLFASDTVWEYRVSGVLLLPIVGASEARQEEYRAYLRPTADSRLTLISCYPPQSNTHRVVVIAKPK